METNLRYLGTCLLFTTYNEKQSQEFIDEAWQDDLLPFVEKTRQVFEAIVQQVNKVIIDTSNKSQREIVEDVSHHCDNYFGKLN